MSPASAACITFASPPANDNGPSDPRICRWRCAIDGFKRMNLQSLAVLTAKEKLRGRLTFDEFAELLIWGLSETCPNNDVYRGARR